MSENKKMELVERSARQGDVLFIRASKIPKNAIKEEVKGPIIVAHSETGHHHIVESPGAEYFKVPGDPFTCFLQLASDAEVKHLREFDTHGSFMLKSGTWLTRRAREHTPEGNRMVVD